MALIECSECNSEVSSHASACPKCGNPITGGNPVKKEKEGHGFLYYLAWIIATPIVLFVGSAIIAGIADSGRPEKPKSDADYMNSAIEHQAELCKNGHMEACDTERSLARLQQAAGH